MFICIIAWNCMCLYVICHQQKLCIYHKNDNIFNTSLVCNIINGFFSGKKKQQQTIKNVCNKNVWTFKKGEFNIISTISCVVELSAEVLTYRVWLNVANILKSISGCLPHLARFVPKLHSATLVLKRVCNLIIYTY